MLGLVLVPLVAWGTRGVCLVLPTLGGKLVVPLVAWGTPGVCLV